uniref:Putative cytoskeletal regulator flightless-i n=1 Tax=Panstrongylus lignarius TaxID=156445 RepID=A0A224XRD2_9HEMI
MELYSSSESSDSDPAHSVKTLDYSYLMLSSQTLVAKLVDLENNHSRDEKPESVQTLFLYNNQLLELPQKVGIFHNLRNIDISNNRLKSLPEFLTHFPLTSLSAKNNIISNESLPKSFLSWSNTLRKLNLGGNNLSHFPLQCLELSNLKYLYIGSNQIEEIPRNINKITGLSILCVGGNRLTDVPDTVGNLEDLEVLIVSDNRLESLPASIANLKKLKTLQLHKNRLRTLPTEIVALKCLSELSLRENPLVVKFVNDMTYNPASLLEISARSIKINNVNYSRSELPQCLIDYLASAHHCLNPKCNGVFFDNRVEHIKFVDFCGKYRVPLLQYLCSSKCVVDNSVLQSQADYGRMRKVLLG